jgi:polyphosphate:AMP phosphotransferase
MLKAIDLSRKVSKDRYKRESKPLQDQLGRLQRRSKALGVPVLLVFEGFDAAGKGTLINDLILPLDPRGFTVYTCQNRRSEDRFFPFLWRFWTKTPARGRQSILDRSWYHAVVEDNLSGRLAGQGLLQAYDDICAFERQLADDGTLILKFFLHISRKVQKRRLKKLRKDPATAWRVTQEDLRRHKQYDRYLEAMDEMLARTETRHAPWTIVEAHDRRFAALKIFRRVTEALEARCARARRRQSAAEDTPAPLAETDEDGSFRTSLLAGADLSGKLDKPEYRKRLKEAQKRLRTLQHEIYQRRIGVVIVYEGWDAAGKGGNIRRLTRRLDPRGYEVIPIAAPTEAEKAHHYLWRFWREMPKAGHIAIFDRSWYGRVLVERVEGFATKSQWMRAYREINEMEQHLVHENTVLLKFWLHIDRDEQLQRFEARQDDPDKQWKITDEDWRNREKWMQYAGAVDEMLLRTGTPLAPWTIVESNDKRYARVKVLETVCQAIEDKLSAKR